jgi:hypothetical protein
VGRQYVVNGRAFDTQKELRNQLRGILHGYKEGEAVSRDHMCFLYALVETYHPSADLKIGIGVAQIEVRPNPIYKNRTFWIVRTDGTETDFSFEECLRPTKQLDKIRVACRNAVAPIMVETKSYFWRGVETDKCPITGEIMTFANSHVHHAGEWSFDRIVTEFVNEYIKDINSVKLTGHLDGQIGDNFKSATLEQQFLDYHNERAILQVVSAYGNLGGAKANLNDRRGAQMPLFGADEGW